MNQKLRMNNNQLKLLLSHLRMSLSIPWLNTKVSSSLQRPQRPQEHRIGTTGNHRRRTRCLELSFRLWSALPVTGILAVGRVIKNRYVYRMAQPPTRLLGGKYSEPQSASKHATSTSHQNCVQIQYLNPSWLKRVASCQFQPPSIWVAHEQQCILFTNNDGVCCYMVSHNIMFIFDVGTNVVLEYVQSSSLVLGRDGNV